METDAVFPPAAFCQRDAAFHRPTHHPTHHPIHPTAKTSSIQAQVAGDQSTRPRFDMTPSRSVALLCSCIWTLHGAPTCRFGFAARPDGRRG
jgi:hypothetical protein